MILGLGTKTGGNIAHGADSGIAGAFGEPDLAQRRVALGDTGPKPQIAATFAPGGDQLAGRLTHRYRHLDRAFCRVGDRYRDGQILLSQRVNVVLKGSVATEQIGALALKGLTQPVVTYNVPLVGSQAAFRVIEGGAPSA